MTIILFDTPKSRQSLYPFTSTRPVCDLRHGICTIREKWERLTGFPVYAFTESHLQEWADDGHTWMFVDATVIPTPEWVTSVLTLEPNSAFVHAGEVIALNTKYYLSYPVVLDPSVKRMELPAVNTLQFPWQLFQTNETAIRSDYELITKGRKSQPIDPSNVCFGIESIFIEPGAVVRACIINAEEGPVYIGEDALVMEGTTIRGPVSIGENSVIKMGAKLYAGTTIGPKCTAGGEIKNSILMGYCNKAHDGYLGDSVIGEWCNLGAGTSNSNVKNTAGTVKMWSNTEQALVPVGVKAGLLMGDYSRAAINTSFNTGTVVGACCNVIATGFPPKHIPSFTWGIEPYDIEKALADIRRWMKMKGMQMNENGERIIRVAYQNQSGR
ncbi:MAG: putative sugar nucleotidyl transferase [Chitinophagaceae bacterium]